MGLTSTVSLASSGLKVTQDATSLVANNIANASTDGYTAKRLNIADIYADSGTVGFKTTVSRAFDQEVYDQLISSTASNSFLDVQATYTGQIDQLMGSTSSGATIPTAIAALSSDLQTLASQPSNSAAQIAVVNSATSVTQSLKSMSSAVTDLSKAVDGDIKDAVSAVNDLTKQIGKINAQVVSYQAQGRDVTGLQDERDKAVLKLSTYMDVQVHQETNGSMRVSTTSALTLVDGTRATQFAQDTKGTLIVANDGNGTSDVLGLGLLSSGSLLALYQIKTDTLPQVQNQLDQVAATLAKAMSTTTTTGTAASGGGLNGYEVDLSSLQSGDTARLTYTDTATGATKTVDFVKVTDPSVLPLTGTASGGDHSVVGIDFSAGAASVATQVQTALGSAFTVSNPSGNVLQVLGDGTSVKVTGVSAASTATTTQSGTAALPLFTDNTSAYTGSWDTGSQLTGLASRLTVNAAVKTDPSLLVKYSGTTEASDTTRPNQLLSAIKTTSDYMTLGNGTAGTSQTLTGFADSMVSYWGSKKTNADTDLANQAVVQKNLQSAMSSVSSVSTDTELAKLIQLQAVYSANAQVLSTLKDMLNTLLTSV
ncbi:flagellar hook-associated protein FlgK [Siculibacillus lacustris]|uniref:Flagellar hook-associated protein 1 n=1 Tax=Siculibacillus lacustris TaxID=1549641 RepID=A0A4Q9VFF5_9HYPH|nr:flagellar hook-associated protein FlgK [Siculibacillus lacustris]TBW33508.1 flagellar hook-associated protein FlgK [Siculibacillus lacustris]